MNTLRITEAINLIHPGINSQGFTYWFVNPKDGSNWDFPIRGLQWENKSYPKPTWEQIKDALKKLEEIDSLNLVKQNKKDEINSHYESLKDIIVEYDNKELVVRADDYWFSFVSNAIQFLEDKAKNDKKAKTKLFFEYFTKFDKGEENVIKLSYNFLVKLRLNILERRSYCKINSSFHLNNIEQLKEKSVIENYCYNSDISGNKKIFKNLKV